MHHFVFLLSLIKLTLSEEIETCVVVVGYQAIDGSDPTDRLEKNTNKYLKILDKVAAKHNVEVIVFPEATLDDVQTHQDLKKYSVKIPANQNPCYMKWEFPNFLRKLSCAAKRYQTAIVFNLIEENSNRFYSSDVVINRKGTIEFSLRREHRVGVSALENFAIPFAVPSRFIFHVLISLTGDVSAGLKFTPTSIVTGFSFSWEKVVATDDRIYVVCSNWISQLPFLTSLQVYQMWAHEFDMTMFVSGGYNPEKGQGGTGIYHGAEGPVLLDFGTNVHVYRLSLNSGSLMSKIVNKTLHQEATIMDKFHLEIDPDLERFESQIIDLKQPTNTVEICYNKTEGNFFCCSFFYNISVSFTSSKHYTYHMVAYKGYKTYYNIFEPGGVEICAIIACLNSDLSSCGRRFDSYEDIEWPVVFEEIVVIAEFGPPVKEKIYFSSQFPNSLLSSIKPIHPNFTKWSGEVLSDGNVKRTFVLVERQKEILTFGIFGRNFTLSDPRSCGIVVGGKRGIGWMIVGLIVLKLCFCCN